MNPFSVAVIGTINLDIIISKKGERTESLGGILYNILTLSEIGKDFIEIFPVTYIGSDTKEKFFKIIKKFQNISRRGIRETSKGTNINLLEYINDNERKETTRFFTDEITYEMIVPFLTSNVLHFNFISGYDVSLETIKKVRKRTNSIISLDVHSLVLKRNDGERGFYALKNWEEWVKNTDIIQMNTKELLFFTGNTTKKVKIGKKIIKEIIKILLGKGIKIVLVTSGEKGVYLGYRNGVYFFKQKYKSVPRDTTGCGDIFSSFFLTKYLISRDPFISCEYANLIAGMSTKDKGIKKCLSTRLFIRYQAIGAHRKLSLS